MKNYLITWESEDPNKIQEYMKNQKVTVTESTEEDAILKGSLLAMEIIASNGKLTCDSTVEDDGICIRIYEQRLRGKKIAEMRKLRAREIWEV